VKRLRIEVPATSANLGPGFDALGLTLDIADTFIVELDPTVDEIVVDEATCLEAGVERCEHYTCKAYRAYAEDTGTALPGASFTLESRIPVGKGLGSSAAAIVAGLAAAAHAAGEKDPEARIVRLAARLEGHPDNSTAATLGGVTVAFCDGEQVRALNVVNHISLGIALFVPDDPLRTVEARAVLPTAVAVSDAIYNLSRSSYLVTALAWGRWEELAPAMQDRLHQPYRRDLIPALDHVISAALEAGACGAALSGGGPAVIALGLREHIGGIAASMQDSARQYDWAGHSIVTNVRSRGVRVTEE
jgi:homoserine kinase